VAVWLQGEDKTGSEGRSLGIFAVASRALQTELLPSPIGRDLDGIAWWRVIGVGRDHSRCHRRCGAGGRRRGTRSGTGACAQSIQQGERWIADVPEKAGSVHSGPVCCWCGLTTLRVELRT